MREIYMNREKALLNVKAIQFARLCSAQKDIKNPIVNIDDEASKALDWLIDFCENYKEYVEVDGEKIIENLEKNIREAHGYYEINSPTLTKQHILEAIDTSCIKVKE
jgi:hypothetical protein